MEITPKALRELKKVLKGKLNKSYIYVDIEDIMTLDTNEEVSIYVDYFDDDVLVKVKKDKLETWTVEDVAKIIMNKIKNGKVVYAFVNGRGEIETTYTEDELSQAEDDISNTQSILGDNDCYVAKIMLVNGEYVVGEKVISPYVPEVIEEPQKKQCQKPKEEKSDWWLKVLEEKYENDFIGYDDEDYEGMPKELKSERLKLLEVDYRNFRLEERCVAFMQKWVCYHEMHSVDWYTIFYRHPKGEYPDMREQIKVNCHELMPTMSKEMPRMSLASVLRYFRNEINKEERRIMGEEEPILFEKYGVVTDMNKCTAYDDYESALKAFESLGNVEKELWKVDEHEVRYKAEWDKITDRVLENIRMSIQSTIRSDCMRVRDSGASFTRIKDNTTEEEREDLKNMLKEGVGGIVDTWMKKYHKDKEMKWYYMKELVKYEGEERRKSCTG